jgi:hypothetical protein
MSKKKRTDFEDDFDEQDGIESQENYLDSEKDQDSEDKIDDVEFESIINEEDDLEIIIEVSEDDGLESIVEEITEEDVDSQEDKFEEIVLSKHQMEGKHSLKYDTIFKGKKDDKLSEDDNTMGYFNEKFEVDKSSFFFTESYDNESYIRSKNLKEKVYAVLQNHTELNFLNNRRKPSKNDFNYYYFLLVKHLDGEKFTNIELFNELSVYFSDNLFNMFKLLDNKWRNMIIKELQDHIGKTSNSKEIKNRNIYVGTEIEFSHKDEFDEIRLYTGVVMETDYQSSYFIVDSYENLYEIHISDITKILNNTKFNYNLNKLDNIDFI